MNSEPVRRRPPKRRSSSYPPQYAKLFLHVAMTGEQIVINTLGNSRAAYTTFRARMNEFRRAYYDEALAESQKEKMMMAEQMYSVTLRDPRQVDGQWQIVVAPREEAHASAIDDLIPAMPLPEVSLPLISLEKEKEETAKETAEVIAKLYGTDEGET